MKSSLLISIITLVCFSALAQEGQTAGAPCEIIKCDNNGVTIGTDSASVPDGYKLAVGGKVIMEVAKVEVESKWPDYVFEKEYDLQNLTDVKKYIETYGHLPNLPAAATVKKDGIDVAQMNVLLMQKIEEITLHIILMQERLNKLKAEREKILNDKASASSKKK